VFCLTADIALSILASALILVITTDILGTSPVVFVISLSLGITIKLVRQGIAEEKFAISAAVFFCILGILFAGFSRPNETLGLILLVIGMGLFGYKAYFEPK
jgi:hypothetical protein